jgi:hypothetical protein
MGDRMGHGRAVTHTDHHRNGSSSHRNKGRYTLYFPPHHTSVCKR